ncbi:GreA/GreB family elongation factor [Pseudonocardia asaccharolytica]|uniref:Transcription elongation factor GreA n=1 Tax=Pseudonocardia asaccharolytica DSM 44247 = NBRC 16224 TaxID=1123024 RepID=A0A511D0S9_9PSEU|nr:GreA/GreB family elongation factor [Pseudonocardia asaccharolytica]GEL18297.1 transcription elongation factor GreA [Pseudonocardia asaccharolytica DSM 44247 = NBRC 16224]
MTEAPQVWLTQDAYERLKEELAELLEERAGRSPGSGSNGSGDANRDSTDDAVYADQRERDQRIRKLQEILQNPLVGHEPPDDGIAEPGMVLTVRFEDETDTETFLLADREQGSYGDIEIYSPDSPLGQALTGAKQGDKRQYRLPNDQTMTVSLVRAVPYGSHLQDL